MKAQEIDILMHKAAPQGRYTPAIMDASSGAMRADEKDAFLVYLDEFEEKGRALAASLMK